MADPVIPVPDPSKVAETRVALNEAVDRLMQLIAAGARPAVRPRLTSMLSDADSVALALGMFPDAKLDDGRVSTPSIEIDLGAALLSLIVSPVALERRVVDVPRETVVWPEPRRAS